jgi:hypothetical protein
LVGRFAVLSFSARFAINGESWIGYDMILKSRSDNKKLRPQISWYSFYRFGTESRPCKKLIRKEAKKKGFKLQPIITAINHSNKLPKWIEPRNSPVICMYREEALPILGKA